MGLTREDAYHILELPDGKNILKYVLMIESFMYMCRCFGFADQYVGFSVTKQKLKNTCVHVHLASCQHSLIIYDG